MIRLLSILLSFFFLTIAQAQSDYLSEFKQKWQNAEAYTMEVAQLMPPEQYSFQPSEEQMTFSEQLVHMLGNIRWLGSSYLGAKKLDVDLKKKDYSKKEIIQLLEKGFSQTKAAIDALTPEVLNEEVSFFAGPMSKRQILNLLNDHLTHHRAQLVVYLRLNGVQPPSYRGW